MTNRYGLLGKKLGHSFSPKIHQMIFSFLNMDASYDLIEKTEEELLDFMESLKSGIYQGINVTIPYKKMVMPYLDMIDEKAKAIGSVNTIWIHDGKLYGYNTDYYGFLKELEHFSIHPKNKQCYVLGTGGASLAIYHVLNDLGGIVKYVSRNNTANNIISYKELLTKEIDILVNTTPVGMYPNVDNCPVEENIIRKAKFVVDIIFNPLQTKLLAYANSHMNGIYMFVFQAIKAEEIWQQKEINIDIDPIIKELR